VDIQSQKQLKGKLRKIINEKNLTEYQTAINKIALELGINPLDCAAPLLYLLQEKLQIPHNQKKINTEQAQACALLDLRMLWYRLEVGRRHQVNIEMLKLLLVEESGVEMSLIGRIDIRDKHTLIQMPNGMPQELLQHLKKVAINQQILDIKRLKNSPKRKPRSGRNKPKKTGTSDLNNKKIGGDYGIPKLPHPEPRKIS
jgi:hypothetical protein